VAVCRIQKPLLLATPVAITCGTLLKTFSRSLQFSRFTNRENCWL